MNKGAERHWQPADEKDDDFCLADAVVKLTDEQLEQLAEDDAQAEVSSCAYEGIPLDKASLKAGLIEFYRKLRTEWPSQRAEQMAEIERISRGHPPALHGENGFRSVIHLPKDGAAGYSG